MAATSFFFVVLAAATLCSLSLSSLSCVEAKKGGFSLELIHRDSPKSPFYNPSETLSQRITNAFRRSIARANHFSPTSISTKEAQSDIISNQGEYLMRISIGTPPFEVLAIADTGSDLIWTQCKPCDECYKQDAPLFDPKRSSTYKVLPCSSNQCLAAAQTSCSGSRTCQYSGSYGDGSFTNGDLAIDTVTLNSTNGRPVVLPKTIIGCGHKNDGTFTENSAGIIGLGGGDVSLISQMGTSVNGQFSYCLVPFGSSSRSIGTSKINFGSDAEVSGSGVVSTPLVKKDPSTFYFLTLEGISVGDLRIDFSSSSVGSNTEEGNIIIDSGTTLTLLPPDFYSRVESAVTKHIDANPIDSPVQGLSLCYNAGTGFKPPVITVHFTDADVTLETLNAFVAVSDEVVCFAFAPNESLSIYGNLSQMNFLVGYDAQKQTVSFKPTDCSKE